MRARPIVILAAALAAGACAGPPGPGDPAYPYNVAGTYRGRLVVDGAEYEAVIRMETADDGTVAGALGSARLDVGDDDPSRTVEGDFSGTVVGDSLVWRSSWIVPSSGCSGVFRGRGPVARSGSSVEGEVHAAGSCGPSGRGSYSLDRR